MFERGKIHPSIFSTWIQILQPTTQNPDLWMKIRIRCSPRKNRDSEATIIWWILEISCLSLSNKSSHSSKLSLKILSSTRLPFLPWPNTCINFQNGTTKLWIQARLANFWKDMEELNIFRAFLNRLPSLKLTTNMLKMAASKDSLKHTATSDLSIPRMYI